MKPNLFPKNLTKRQKSYRNFTYFLSLLSITLLALLLYTKHFARWTPDYDKEPLPTFSKVADLTDEDLSLLYAQTGLTEIGLLRLESDNRLSELESFQYSFFLEATPTKNTPEALSSFTPPIQSLPMLWKMNSPISWEESILDLEGNRGAYLPLVPLESGDILLTPNSHSYGLRQGHAALVIDPETTLESVVLGTNSMLQWAGKWQGFPAVIVLRPKDQALAQVAVDYALTYLFDVPYLLTIGVFSEKFLQPTNVQGTNCSHLVWQAYQWAGIDIDANGWIQVLPQDMATSEHLEIVQIYGINPNILWSH